MCFPYRRSPSAQCLREPTTTAERGTTLGARIIGTFLSLCHCALCAGYATTRRSRLYFSSSSTLDTVGALRLHTTNIQISLIGALQTNFYSGVGNAHPQLLIINFLATYIFSIFFFHIRKKRERTAKYHDVAISVKRVLHSDLYAVLLVAICAVLACDFYKVAFVHSPR